MRRPTRKTVQEEIEKFGTDPDLYASQNSRNRAKNWFIKENGEYFDLKAVWSNAYSPPISTKEFHTSYARRKAMELGFDVINIKLHIESVVFEKKYSERCTLIEKLLSTTVRSLIASRDKKIAAKYTCEACNFKYSEKYFGFDTDYLETHHIIPASNFKFDREITLDDLIALCANCHRMIHRLIAKTNKPATLEQFKQHIKQA